MTTPHVPERMLAYVSGELTESERASIDAHVRACDACRSELHRVRTAVDALSAWPREPALPPVLEERILGRVMAQPSTSSGRMPWRGARWTRAAASIAIALASGVAGFGLGRASSGSVGAGTGAGIAVVATRDSSQRSYLLLLEERVWPPPRPLARTGYTDWARAMATQSRFGGAEKLTEEPGFRVDSSGRVERPAASDRPPNVSGWYVVRASSYDDAIAWARRGPHLAYGSVLVREIEETPATLPRSR